MAGLAIGMVGVLAVMAGLVTSALISLPEEKAHLRWPLVAVDVAVVVGGVVVVLAS